MIVTPSRIYEGFFTVKDGQRKRLTSAVYPPLRYEKFEAWACVHRLPALFPRDDFIFGQSAEDATARAIASVRELLQFLKADLITEEGFDFATFTADGYSLPWGYDDPEDNPGLSSYESWREPLFHLAPGDAPVRRWNGWLINDAEAAELVSAEIYSPDFDDVKECWGCLVRFQAIFQTNKKVYGEDADQALELAEWFLKELWNHHRVVPRLT